MEYTRINWQNTADTPLNATNLNKMEKAIAELLNELTSFKQLEQLAVFSNQSNSVGENCVNFKITKGYNLTYGTLDIADSKLIIINEEYASTQLVAELKNNVLLNSDKNILLKLRVKATTNASIYPKLELTDGTSIFVTASDIIVSNLDTTNTPSYTLPENQCVDIWCIIGADTDTEIESIVLHIAPYTTLEIASLCAFYRLDKCTESNSVAVVTSTSTFEETNLTFTKNPYTEGEI